MIAAALLALAGLCGAVAVIALLEWSIAGILDHRRERARRGQRADISQVKD